MPVEAYAALEAKEHLNRYTYDPGPLGAHEVEVQITQCGVCHSDIHLIDNDWGISKYPLVPGHEVVGTISAIGSAVTLVREGLRVGIGWQADSCGVCRYCRAGEENLCPNIVATCVNHMGGYADRVRANERFVIPIPNTMDSATVAPLLCAGVTVYSPLRNFEVRPYMSVAIIGLGGLGHLAVQFAAAFGCEVTVFSASESKRAEAHELGAMHFVNTAVPGALAEAADQYDFILNTAPADFDWEAMIAALRPKGRLCLLAAPGHDIRFPGFLLIGGQRSISGSNIGSPAVLREMLEFCARHGIKPIIERFPMSDVNEAISRMRANRVRYRAVLENGHP